MAKNQKYDDSQQQKSKSKGKPANQSMQDCGDVKQEKQDSKTKPNKQVF